MTSSQHKPRILVVDDEPVTRELLEMTLNDTGFEAKSCPDGAYALEILAVDSFDLLLTDLSMPEMDGYELISSVKALWPQMPVLVMTADHSTDAIRRVHEYGVYGFVTKPFEQLEALVKKVRDTLATAEQRAAIRKRLQAASRALGKMGGSDPTR